MIFENPLVSIITPSYNSSRFIKDTIESVLNQTYLNWELLISDDCSTDNSVEIIKSYIKLDPRIKLFCLSSNVGAASARNISIKNAKGMFIAFLDSDDIWKNDKLERQVKFMQDNNYAFTFSSYDQMYENGVNLNRIIRAPKCIDYKRYRRNTIIGCLTVMINREMTGDFTMPLIRTSHDMALWLLIMKRGFVAFGMNEVTATYRLVSTSNSSKKWKAAKDVWTVYRQFEKLSYIESIYNFIGYSYNGLIKRI
jgi:teichuronic acid biosynthesis glycosyltransferase TuaG